MPLLLWPRWSTLKAKTKAADTGEEFGYASDVFRSRLQSILLRTCGANGCSITISALSTGSRVRLWESSEAFARWATPVVTATVTTP